MHHHKSLLLVISAPLEAFVFSVAKILSRDNQLSLAISISDSLLASTRSVDWVVDLAVERQAAQITRTASAGPKVSLRLQR